MLREAVERKDSLKLCVQRMNFTKIVQGEEIDISGLSQKDHEIVSIIEKKLQEFFKTQNQTPRFEKNFEEILT